MELVSNLKIVNIAHGGWGVARPEGKVFFVAGAIPGDVVNADVFQSKKSFAKADAVELVEASPSRRAHIWPASDIDKHPGGRPGGADYGHIIPAAQLRYKSQILAESMQKFAGVTIDDDLVKAIGEHDQGWRTRVDLHVGESGFPGPYAERTKNIIKVGELPLATTAINETEIHKQEFFGAQRIRVIDNRGEIRLVIDKQKPSTITELAGGYEFQLADNGFWQVHKHAAETLFKAVGDLIDDSLFDPKANNHDLYGGVGLMAAAVANKDKETKIISVESDTKAVDYASANLSFAPHARSVEARVDKYLKQTLDNGGRLNGATIVMDPPRVGAGRDTMQNLTAMKPAQIIYVACDPVALARDVEYASQAGYQLAEIKAFDLFPNTHHFEAVARLTL